MERVEAAYRAGIAEAGGDIAQVQPKLRYGARGAWGEDLANPLRARFGVELVDMSCLTDPWLSSLEAGYNATIEAHIDGIHGCGALASVMSEIQNRRKAAYDLWASEQKQL